VRSPDPTAILQHLLTVTTACRDAFTEAAYAVRSPRLSALFVRRAEHQCRIAAFLEESLPAGRPITEPDGAARLPATSPLGTGVLVRACEPHALLGACIRQLDTSILEFGRAFGPTMPLAQRISLERHHDQMKWSRDELFSVRRTYKPPRVGLERVEESPQPVMGERWFGLPADGALRSARRAAQAPSEDPWTRERDSGPIS